jgi:hypothetical protein
VNETAVVQFLTGWRAVDDLEISMAMDREPEETRFPHVILRNLHKSAFILRDPGLAFGTPKIPHPQASDAGVTIVAYQPARFGKLGGDAVVLAFESIGRGSERAELWVSRGGIARPFRTRGVATATAKNCLIRMAHFTRRWGSRPKHCRAILLSTDSRLLQPSGEILLQICCSCIGER